MAGEITYQDPGAQTGLALYAVVRASADRVALGAVLETYNAAHWTSYAISLADRGAGYYDADFPALPAGLYQVEVRFRVGGSPAVTDPVVGGPADYWWPIAPVPSGGWPTHAAVLALLYEGGRALPAPDAILEAGIDIELPRVIAYVEGPPAPDGTGGTGRSFTPTVEQRLFDGTYRNELDVFDLVPADQGGSAIAVVTMPGSGAITGTPVAVRNGLTEGWDRLALQWDGAAALPRFPLGRRNIGVTATWGYRAAVPLPLAGAVAAEVARLVIVGSKVALAGAGETKSIGSYSINTSAGVSVWPQSSPIGVNHERFLEAMKMYRDPRALDRVRFGPAAVRALWGR